MICSNCQEQFIATLKNQSKCFTCEILDACRKEKKDKIKELLINIDNRLLEAKMEFQKMGRGDINHKLENIIYSLSSGFKLLKTELKNNKFV